jgi:hypothetical protein
LVGCCCCCAVIVFSCLFVCFFFPVSFSHLTGEGSACRLGARYCKRNENVEYVRLKSFLIC